MHLLVVTTWYPTAKHPGAGSFIARDARALAEVHDVHVVHFVEAALDDGEREFVDDGVRVTRVPLDVRRPLGMLRARVLLGRLLRTADVLHTMAAPALLPFVAVRPRRPWVHTEHWSGIIATAGPRSRRIARIVARRMLRGPDMVVAVSEHLAHAVRQLRPGPVEVVGNIVDAALSGDHRPASSASGLRVLGVGTVAEHKGWEIAAAAVRLLRERGSSAELTWIGSGPQSDRLDALADDPAAAVIAPGQLPADAVRAAMADADVFVLPTAGETFSLVTVEALAAGTPPVVSDVGAQQEFIAPGAGLVVARTADAFAAGILEAATQDRGTVRRHGSTLVERFSESSFQASYDAVYTRVTHD